MVLVALAAGARWFYRRHVSTRVVRPTIPALFQDRSPVADGTIGEGEYGPPVTITWAEGDMLAAFQPTLLDPSSQTYRVDRTKGKSLPT